MNNPQSNIESLALIKRLTGGYGLRLRPFETVKEVKKNGDTVGVLVETYQWQERRIDYKLSAKGLRLVSIKPVPPCFWDTQQVVMWEDDFTPFYINKFGNGRSPEQAAVRLAHERMAYRVGNDRAPLDNYSRTTQHADYSPRRMQGHWGNK